MNDLGNIMEMGRVRSGEKLRLSGVLHFCCVNGEVVVFCLNVMEKLSSVTL